MSSSLKSLEINLWPYEIGSNYDQSYLTHSIFRYFGKLPPVLTGQLIEEYAFSISDNPVVWDPMCGSGTTLVECQKRGIQSVGVDANDIAVLASKVKTSPLDSDRASKALTGFRDRFDRYIEHEQRVGYADPAENSSQLETWHQYIPGFRNRDKWFRGHAQHSLAVCREWIEEHRAQDDIYNFLLLSWLGIIRKVSNASVRPGRIFHDHDKEEQPVFSLLLKRLEKNLDTFTEIPDGHFDPPPNILKGDARSIPLPKECDPEFAILHPPYFALYRYSSDVLRFELEWSDFSRKTIRRSEIEEGFKTTNPDLMYDYIDDLTECIENVSSQMANSSIISLVIGNSTLSEKQLPIIETLLDRLSTTSIVCSEIIERPINHAQANYHKSANPSINSDSDYILILEVSA